MEQGGEEGGGVSTTTALCRNITKYPLHTPGTTALTAHLRVRELLDIPVDGGAPHPAQQRSVREGALIDDDPEGQPNGDGEADLDAQEHGGQERTHPHTPVQLAHLQDRERARHSGPH